MSKHIAQLLQICVGAQFPFEPPEGCDGYPHTCHPIVVGNETFLVLVWRVPPPPIPTAPPKKPKKAKP